MKLSNEDKAVLIIVSVLLFCIGSVVGIHWNRHSISEKRKQDKVQEELVNDLKFECERTFDTLSIGSGTIVYMDWMFTESGGIKCSGYSNGIIVDVSKEGLATLKEWSIRVSLRNQLEFIQALYRGRK